MNAGRRRVLLSAGFLGLALLLTNSMARAQERSSHQLWQKNLTPDQVREAFARMGSDFGDLSALHDMVKDYLLKSNPDIDKEKMEQALKNLTGNKQVMDSLKQFAKQNQTDPGRPGKLTQEDLAKWAKSNQGNLPDLPPDLKGFDFKPEPGKGQPPGNKGVPPGMGDPIPKQVVPPPGMGDPIPKKLDPPVPPDPQPVPPQPVPPAPKDKDTISLDKNPFPEPEESTDPRTKSLEAFAAMWERNVGPLKETPEVQRALFDLVSGDNGFDFDIKDEKGNSLWDLLKKGDGSSSSFGDLLNNSGTSGNWNFGNWEFPKFNNWFGSNRPSGSSWFGSSPSSSRPSSSSSSWGSGWGSSGGFGGLGGAWVPFVLLLLVILGVFVWFQLKNLRDRTPSLAFAADGLGPWPVDPRSIDTREDVVKAFEYLSVLICGPSARNWTHGTIAAALSDLAMTHGETATMLARLYELARYAPLDEPLTRTELIEARELVCSLAGVSY